MTGPFDRASRLGAGRWADDRTVVFPLTDLVRRAEALDFLTLPCRPFVAARCHARVVSTGCEKMTNSWGQAPLHPVEKESRHGGNTDRGERQVDR